MLYAICQAAHAIAGGMAAMELEPGQRIKLWRNRDGTTIEVDLNGRTVGPGVTLRLVSRDDVVSLDRFNRLVIRNARVLGTLDLSDIVLDTAVWFDVIYFSPPDDGVCGVRRAKGPSPQEPAIWFVGAQVKRCLVFTDSRCECRTYPPQKCRLKSPRF